jgi:hypothetical protein
MKWLLLTLSVVLISAVMVLPVPDFSKCTPLDIQTLSLDGDNNKEVKLETVAYNCSGNKLYASYFKNTLVLIKLSSGNLYVDSAFCPLAENKFPTNATPSEMFININSCKPSVSL